MLVAIEGIDGVGKTTCIELITRASSFLRAPSNSISDIKKIRKAKEEGANEHILFVHYLDSMISRSNAMRPLLDKGQNIIVDRWIGTQTASHLMYCEQQKLIPLSLDWDLLPVIRPSLSFLLTAQEHIRGSRLYSRGGLSQNDLRSLAVGAQEFFYTEIRRVSRNLIEIDTSYLEAPEVVSLILDEIKSHIVIANE